jgi:hypothetical protein
MSGGMGARHASLPPKCACQHLLDACPSYSSLLVTSHAPHLECLLCSPQLLLSAQNCLITLNL